MSFSKSGLRVNRLNINISIFCDRKSNQGVDHVRVGNCSCKISSDEEINTIHSFNENKQSVMSNT